MVRSILRIGVALSFAMAGRASAGEQKPKHLLAAEDLVKHLDLSNTSYQHEKPEVSFASPYKSHTDCSGFVDALLGECYGYKAEQFKKWFGQERPTADHYHDAVLKQEIFEEIKDFRKASAGDILAIKYKNPKAKSTGHVMLVAGPPKAMASKEPVKPGMQQWEVPVIDSARSGHGKTDSRHGKAKDGKDHDGLGEGVLRVYTNEDGQVAGYTWSVTGHEFLTQEDNHMVIGRLKP